MKGKVERLRVETKIEQEIERKPKFENDRGKSQGRPLKAFQTLKICNGRMT